MNDQPARDIATELHYIGDQLSLLVLAIQGAESVLVDIHTAMVAGPQRWFEVRRRLARLIQP